MEIRNAAVDKFLYFAWQVKCADHFYGEDCSTHCVYIQEVNVKLTSMNVLALYVKTVGHVLMVSILMSAIVLLGMLENGAIWRSVNVRPCLV